MDRMKKEKVWRGPKESSVTQLIQLRKTLDPNEVYKEISRPVTEQRLCDYCSKEYNTGWCSGHRLRLTRTA